MMRRTLLAMMPLALVSACASPVALNSSGIDAPGCEFLAGNENLVIASTLLLKEGAMGDGAVAVGSDGTIADVGTFESVRRSFPDASLLNCVGTVLSPGWVNAHEHVGYSYAFPNDAINPNYVHRDEWRFGTETKPRLGSPIPYSYGGGENQQGTAIVAWVELRHLLSGTTTIAGSGAVPGLAHNINVQREPSDELLYRFQADMRTFPLAFRAIDEYESICETGQGGSPNLQIDPLQSFSYVPHVGEGAHENCTAQNEIKSYLNYVENRPDNTRRFSIIHGVAADETDFLSFAENDVTLVWSPRSNLSLYGQTTRVKQARDLGVRIAMGSDWSPSGSFTMLQEFRCAEKVNQYYDAGMDAKDLWEIATINSAYALGLENSLGTIEQGKHADLVLYRTPVDVGPYSAVINATTEDVLAVWVKGALTIADTLLIGVDRNSCFSPGLGSKSICMDLDSLKLTEKLLVNHNAKSVPLIGGFERQASCSLTEE